ncbi:MAG: division/cell wall cluster transcriptional repressor MraZ [Armatimonadetes bacterium]|jgi:MraZ protein|nr:division/cell wall cluster transcriptional repressor MraZ [Armatimonadota bacterium]
MGFRGEHYHGLDEKGRVIMPLKFRNALGNSFVITRGIGPCLSVYRESDFDLIEENLNKQPSLDPHVLRMKRLLCAPAVDTDTDNQGRVALPANLRQWAGIDTEVVVVGMGEKIEIWSRSGWIALNESLEDELIVASARETGLARTLTGDVSATEEFA